MPKYEEYKPSEKEVDSAEVMMSDKEKISSENREVTFVAGRESVKHDRAKASEAKKERDSLKREDEFQYSLFREQLDDIRRYKGMFKDGERKGSLDFLIAKRDLLEKIAKKINDPKLREFAKEEIGHVFTSYDSDNFNSEPLTREQKDEISLAKKELDLKELAGKIRGLYRSAMALSPQGLPIVENKKLYSELKDSLPEFSRMIGEMKKFAKDKKIMFWSDKYDDLVQQIERSISLI